MTDDAKLPLSDDARKLLEEVRSHLSRSGEPLTGRDAAVFKRSADEVFEAKIRDRGLQSEGEIREISRDVSRAIFREMFEPFRQQLDNIEDRIASFLPREEIKKGMLDALAEIGLNADEQHRFETRTKITKLFQDQSNRSENIKTLFKEILKGFASQLVLVGAGAVAWFWSQKSGGH